MIPIKIERDFMDITVDLTRIEENIKKAQFALDIQIMRDYEPLMPRQAATFIQLTHAKSMAVAGTGKVYAGVAPMGHYLHTGKVMVDPVTRSAWARKGVKKVYTDKDLRLWYPTARTHWSDVAKTMHMQEWIRLVKQIVAEG